MRALDATYGIDLIQKTWEGFRVNCRVHGIYYECSFSVSDGEAHVLYRCLDYFNSKIVFDTNGNGGTKHDSFCIISAAFRNLFRQYEALPLNISYCAYEIDYETGEVMTDGELQENNNE